MRPLRSVLSLGLLLLPPLPAAGPPPQDPQLQRQQQQQQPATALDPTTEQALQRLAALLGERRAALADARARGDAAAQALADEVRAASWQFAGLAARLDVQQFEAPAERRFDLRGEFEQLVRPLLQSLKDATAGPREAADLQARIDELQERQRVAEQALRAVERTRDALAPDTPARAEAERELAGRWRPLIGSLRDEVLVLQANLLRRQEGEVSLPTRLRTAVQSFLQNSGTSLLLAAAVFLVVFFGLRALVDRALQRRRRAPGFSLRLVEVVLRALVVVAAVLATLVVPYVRNDWFLLAIGIVFLLGAGWVVVRTLPQVFEQVRLLLNVGGVREGERILVDGLPFRVAGLRWYTRLENPDLQGGVLRVPLQFLVGRRSRESGPGEPWFPCRVGDVVLLADGAFGPVRVQTPEVVVVTSFGAERSYPTTTFLQLSPRNLSRGFVVDAVLAVGRAQLADVTTVVRERLEQALGEALRRVVPATQVRSVTVQFQAVQPHALELLALADCDGAAALHHFTLRRAMQAAFVTAARQHGWTLPTPLLVAPAG